MERTASADWTGSLCEGMGRISTASGALNILSYSYAPHFGERVGTNPEELSASAQAGCFTMALSVELEKLGLKPISLHTDATATLLQENSKWRVNRIHLNVYGRVPGSTPDQFNSAVSEAKANCLISRLLNAEITLGTKLLAENEELPRVEKNIPNSSSAKNPREAVTGQPMSTS